MSMLSAQVDELRSMSESVGLAMPQAATLMMEAADTIDSLDLALDSKRIAERRVTELLDENAKLRELAVLNWEWAHSCCGNNCKMQTDGCGYQIDRECNYEREIYDCMRELGVEVEA